MPYQRGSAWIQQAFKRNDMSPLGEKVADLLGDVWSGIYHMDTNMLKAIDWTNPHFIEVDLPRHSGELATYDGNKLTILVIRAHDKMLRLSIEALPNKMGVMRLMFHQRTTRVGNLFERMPTIEAHVKHLRQYYPAPEE